MRESNAKLWNTSKATLAHVVEVFHGTSRMPGTGHMLGTRHICLVQDACMILDLWLYTGWAKAPRTVFCSFYRKCWFSIKINCLTWKYSASNLWQKSYINFWCTMAPSPKKMLMFPQIVLNQYVITFGPPCILLSNGRLMMHVKKSAMKWDLRGTISSGYFAHCSHPFFMSICVEFSASYSMLSSGLVTPTSLARLFINPEFCQCPLRRICQTAILIPAADCVLLLHLLVIGLVTVHLM